MSKKWVKKAVVLKIDHLIAIREFLSEGDRNCPKELEKHLNKKIRKVSEKHNISLSKAIKYSFCRQCFSRTKKQANLKDSCGREYVPMYCDVCDRIVRKDFLIKKQKCIKT